MQTSNNRYVIRRVEFEGEDYVFVVPLDTDEAPQVFRAVAGEAVAVPDEEAARILAALPETWT